MDAATEQFFRRELAQVQRQLRAALTWIEALQDTLGSGPVEYRLEVTAVRQKQRSE